MNDSDIFVLTGFKRDAVIKIQRTKNLKHNISNNRVILNKARIKVKLFTCITAITI